MKKFALSMLVAMSFATPAFAESKLKKGFYSMDALGCMITRECSKDVKQIKSIDDIRKVYPDTNFDLVADEFNSMLVSLDKIGVMVFLGIPASS